MGVEETEVLMVGAGLAGLRCAGVLAAAGRGFHCDRGFQVLNPAYPELEHCVDLQALKLQPFRAGLRALRSER